MSKFCSKKEEVNNYFQRDFGYLENEYTKCVDDDGSGGIE